MPVFSIFSTPRSLSDPDRKQRRHALARLAVAWLVMMQVMMLAWPAYLRHDAMDAEVLETLDWAIVLMNWTSLVLTIPVMVYSAWPIWHRAMTGLRHGRIGMDVPVALGLMAAFLPSVWTTWRETGPVYFDSVTMFAAFLLTARYLELCARQSAHTAAHITRLNTQRMTLGAWGDRLAARFTWIQLALAAATAVVWQIAGLPDALPVVVAMLVVSCPCAMAMAVPTALAAAQAVLTARPDLPATDQLEIALTNTARTSLYGSLAWHVLLTPLAALGWVAPQVAAVTMLASSLAVAGNAWRLRRRFLTRTVPLVPARDPVPSRAQS